MDASNANRTPRDDALRIVGDRLVIEVDGLSESTSQMFARLVRAGAICRNHGIRKVLYSRRGNSVDPLTVAQIAKSLPDFGFKGCRIAMLFPSTDAAYPWLFVEQLAAQADIRLEICDARSRADAFLDGADERAARQTDASNEDTLYARCA